MRESERKGGVKREEGGETVANQIAEYLLEYNAESFDSK